MEYPAIFILCFIFPTQRLLPRQKPLWFAKDAMFISQKNLGIKRQWMLLKMRQKIDHMLLAQNCFLLVRGGILSVAD